MLTIETSTAERVTGSFELVAANGEPDDDTVETITVTGEFVRGRRGAHPR